MWRCWCLVEIFSWCLVEILKMKCDQDLCLNLWYDLKKLLWQDEFNPRVRCAFGNVFFTHLTFYVARSLQWYLQTIDYQWRDHLKRQIVCIWWNMIWRNRKNKIINKLYIHFQSFNALIIQGGFVTVLNILHLALCQGFRTRCQIWCTIEFHKDSISKVLSEL